MCFLLNPSMVCHRSSRFISGRFSMRFHLDFWVIRLYSICLFQASLVTMLFGFAISAGRIGVLVAVTFRELDFVVLVFCPYTCLLGDFSKVLARFRI